MVQEGQKIPKIIGFPDFDPLRAKQASDSEVAIKALKRELTNILDDPTHVIWTQA